METVEQITKKQFNDLEKHAIQMCVDFETNQLPLTTIKELIDIARIKRIRSKRIYSKHFKAFNSTLDTLMKVCTKSANSMDKSYIPISFFCKFIEIINGGIDKGLKK